jgi:hypothetical protein
MITGLCCCIILQMTIRWELVDWNNAKWSVIPISTKRMQINYEYTNIVRSRPIAAIAS